MHYIFFIWYIGYVILEKNIFQLKNTFLNICAPVRWENGKIILLFASFSFTKLSSAEVCIIK